MSPSKTALPPTSSGKSFVSRSWVANLLLVLLSTGLGIWALHLVRERFTSIASRDAVVNGVLVDVNAPIEGVVTQFPVTTGTTVQPNQTLAVLNNPNLVAQASQLPAQEIKTQIKELESRLEAALSNLAQTRAMIALWSQEQNNQQQLEVQDSQNVIREAEADLQAMQSRYRLADLTYQRTATLLEAGAISQAVFDSAALAREELGNQVKSLEARLESARNQGKAANLGFNLERERNDSSPRLRLQNLKLQEVEQQQDIAQLEQSLTSARAELAQANADYQSQQTELKRSQQTTVKTPTPGVMWDLTAKQGQFVEKGATLGRVLNCRRRWVDVYVDEQALKSLRHGMPATIEMYGDDSQTLRGHIALIRSGLGRLQAGQDIAIPLTPNLPRTTQVRVDLDPNTAQGSPDVLCYVGYTAKVTFHL